MNADQIELPRHESKLQGFDKTNLWRIEIVSDTMTGDIRVLTPITVGNVRDTARPTRYLSNVNVMFQGRVVPVNFEIEAGNLEEAIDRFKEQGDRAGAEMIERLQSQVVRQQIMGTAGPRPN